MGREVALFNWAHRNRLTHIRMSRRHCRIGLFSRSIKHNLWEPSVLSTTSCTSLSRTPSALCTPQGGCLAVVETLQKRVSSNVGCRAECKNISACTLLVRCIHKYIHSTIREMREWILVYILYVTAKRRLPTALRSRELSVSKSAAHRMQDVVYSGAWGLILRRLAPTSRVYIRGLNRLAYRLDTGRMSLQCSLVA